MSNRGGRDYFRDQWLRFNDRGDMDDVRTPVWCDCKHLDVEHDDATGKCRYGECRCPHFRPFISDLEDELHRIFSEQDSDEAKQ